MRLLGTWGRHASPIPNIFDIARKFKKFGSAAGELATVSSVTVFCQQK